MLELPLIPRKEASVIPHRDEELGVEAWVVHLGTKRENKNREVPSLRVVLTEVLDVIGDVATQIWEPTPHSFIFSVQ